MQDHQNHQGHHHEGAGHQSADSGAIPLPSWKNWIPLMVVVATILTLTAVQLSLMGYSLVNLLSFSMGYFFIIFALFKLIDLPGFAEGFAHYDIIAKRYRAWGYIFPFVEYLLGVAYLLRINSIWVNLITIFVSLVVCAGVGIKLAKREKFICACLGTVLKVPLTKVSLVEYAVMALMAAVMIFI